MPAWTLTTATAKLEEWKSAETKVAEGQAYSVGGRALTRADLGEIRRTISFYSDLVTTLERPGTRIRGGVAV